MTARPFLLDCDTGVDDALALLHLLSDPQVDLVGISTVSGNTSARQAAENTLRLLALVGRTDVPVAVGEHDFLRTGFGGGVEHVHGANGIGGVDLPPSPVAAVVETGPELIVRMAHAHAGRLHLVPIGPLTNLAKALELDPALPSLVASVTIMGGAALAPGNITAVAEANIWHDPEAAQAVLTAGWPVTIVGLDVTMGERLEEEDRARLLAAPDAVAPAIGAILGVYFDFYRGPLGRASCALHDPLAAAIATGEITPTVAPLVRVSVDTTDGPGRGQTICDLRGLHSGFPPQSRANARVVLATDRPYAPLLMARLLSFGASTPEPTPDLKES